MKIAVTGGIGSGKSSVAALLADAVQADLFSADLACHELMQPDADGWLGIVAAWGERYLKPDRTIDRGLMRDAVFRDEAMRRQLESILHPLIRRELMRKMAAVAGLGGRCVVEIPLLFEVGWQDEFDATVVVYAPEDVCVRRIVARDGIGEEAARRILDAQMSPETKAEMATHVVNNAGLWAQTVQQISSLARLLAKNFKEKGKPADTARQGLTPQN